MDKSELLSQMTSEYAGRPTTSIGLTLPVDLLNQVKEAADLEGTDTESIINCYVHHGILSSKAELKRLHFAEHAKDVLKSHGVHDETISAIMSKFFYL